MRSTHFHALGGDTPLGSFEVDFVKIDGAFGLAALSNPRDALLLRSIAGFCRETGIATIAEKVEQEAHAAEFELLGLTHAQGYHFGRPLAQPNAVAAPPKIKQRRAVLATWA